MATQDSSKAYSELDYTRAADRKKYPFYHADITHKIPPELQDFLEKYSHIPRDQQIEHIHKIRDRAFDIRAYPCTGLGSWLVPQLRLLPNYAQILDRAKAGATVLDIGTFIGHDLRRLVYDGAPSNKLYGVDIVSHFDIGYDFFRDASTFHAHFIEADFLSAATTPDKCPELAALQNSVDVLIVSQVLHQWNRAAQVHAATVLAGFTKPGSVVVGNQVGNVVAQEVSLKVPPVALWRHNAESWAKMWDEVGQATATKWEAQAWLRTFEDMGWDPRDAAWMEDGVRLMEFVVTRVA